MEKVSEDIDVHPLVIFERVGVSCAAISKFSPILKAYVTRQYQQGEIIHHGIHIPAILHQDLSALKKDTAWVFTRAKLTGKYSLAPQDPPM
ncbi:hypothetical protein FRB91_004885 [Serendipita sp. 411]|nr:hypothetical protein FRC15_011093 [Serendipita sp. 397]KAG8792568.1 hypothetical protein FRC16_011348 [Serendipita sp. 398]KAG8841573.1 hypothetical protein FRB91_004885 [Serendipita sp. 411]KAG8861070.1 hypothetical protein FRC20_011529 [Serendipita sp. 405]